MKLLTLLILMKVYSHFYTHVALEISGMTNHLSVSLHTTVRQVIILKVI